MALKVVQLCEGRVARGKCYTQLRHKAAQRAWRLKQRHWISEEEKVLPPTAFCHDLRDRYAARSFDSLRR